MLQWSMTYVTCQLVYDCMTVCVRVCVCVCVCVCAVVDRLRIRLYCSVGLEKQKRRVSIHLCRGMSDVSVCLSVCLSVSFVIWTDYILCASDVRGVYKQEQCVNCQTNYVSSNGP